MESCENNTKLFQRKETFKKLETVNINSYFGLINKVTLFFKQGDGEKNVMAK